MSDAFTDTANAAFQDFLSIGLQVRDLAKLLGKKLEPVHQTADPCFLRLSKPDQLATVERLKVYQQLVEMMSAEGAPQTSEKRLLWLALKLLKFVPGSDLMTVIEEDDLVEVLVGNRQVYRSFNYYDFCSYSFDELECVPWENLFYREDPHVLELMMQEGAEVIRSRKLMISNTPEHIVRETSSPFQNKVSYRLKYIIPIKDAESGRSDCLVTVLSARLLESVPKENRILRMQAHLESRSNVTQLF